MTLLKYFRNKGIAFDNQAEELSLKTLSRLIDIERDLRFISIEHLNLGDDLEYAKYQIESIGTKLSIIQNEIATLKQIDGHQSRLDRVNKTLLTKLVMYYDYKKQLRRGKIPGKNFVSHDIKVQFNVDQTDDQIECQQFVGKVKVENGIEGLNEEILGYLFENKDSDNIAVVDAGSYIPETWYYGPYVFWDPTDGFVDVVCSTGMIDLCGTCSSAPEIFGK